MCAFSQYSPVSENIQVLSLQVHTSLLIPLAYMQWYTPHVLYHWRNKILAFSNTEYLWTQLERSHCTFWFWINTIQSPPVRRRLVMERKNGIIFLVFQPGLAGLFDSFIKSIWFMSLPFTLILCAFCPLFKNGKPCTQGWIGCVHKFL